MDRAILDGMVKPIAMTWFTTSSFYSSSLSLSFDSPFATLAKSLTALTSTAAS